MYGRYYEDDETARDCFCSRGDDSTPWDHACKPHFG